MARKSTLYRRLWYVRKRNTGRIHVVLRLITALLIFASLFSLLTAGLLPWFRKAVELEIRDTYTASLDEAAAKVFSYGVGYKDMIVFQSAADGSMTALSLDKERLDELTDELLYKTDKKLGLPDDWTVRVSMTDPENPIFKPGLLGFNVSVRQDAKPAINYISEYIPVNGGQTRLKVTLAADAEVNYKGSFLEGNTKITAMIPVAEFVILGKLPD